MASPADGFKKILHQARAIPGKLGLRPYRVYVVTAHWTSLSFSSENQTEITHADGQPPKVRWLSQEERNIGGFEQITAEIGPITPPHPGGGFSIEQLNPLSELNSVDTLYILLVGPQTGDCGKKFAVRSVTSDKALHYSLTVELSDTGRETS